MCLWCLHVCPISGCKIVTDERKTSSVLLLLFGGKRDKGRCTNLFGVIFQTIWFSAAEGQKFRRFNMNHEVLYVDTLDVQIDLIKSMTVWFESPVKQ